MTLLVETTFFQLSVAPFKLHTLGARHLTASHFQIAQHTFEVKSEKSDKEFHNWDSIKASGEASETRPLDW